MNHWAGDTSLVEAGVGSNPTLAKDLSGLDSNLIHELKFFNYSCINFLIVYCTFIVLA